jgi:hypothetical protein
VVKLNGSGTIEWQKTLGGTDQDQGRSILQTSDNGFMIAGGSDSNDGDVSGNHGSYDFWLVKLAPYVGVDEIHAEENSISLFPNPASNQLAVSSRQTAAEKIEIFNHLGAEVFQSQIPNIKSQILIDVSQLPSGIYFVKVKTDKGIRAGKFVKQ